MVGNWNRTGLPEEWIKFKTCHLNNRLGPNQLGTMNASPVLVLRLYLQVMGICEKYLNRGNRDIPSFIVLCRKSILLQIEGLWQL
jgi:hypothetical protein